MRDLIDELRDEAELAIMDECPISAKTYSKAADEIERLQAENKLLNDVYEAAKRVNAEVWADDAGGYDPAWFEVEEAIADVLEGKDDE